MLIYLLKEIFKHNGVFFSSVVLSLLFSLVPNMFFERQVYTVEDDPEIFFTDNTLKHRVTESILVCISDVTVLPNR